MVQCDECGAEYLSALERREGTQERLVQRVYGRDEDEFQQELDVAEADDESGEPDDEAADAGGSGQPRLLADCPDAPSPRLGPDGALDWTGTAGTVVHLLVPEHDGCVVCGERERAGRTFFQPVRVGAPFLLGTAHSDPLRLPAGFSQRTGTATARWAAATELHRQPARDGAVRRQAAAGGRARLRPQSPLSLDRGGCGTS